MTPIIEELNLGVKIGNNLTSPPPPCIKLVLGKIHAFIFSLLLKRIHDELNKKMPIIKYSDVF